MANQIRLTYRRLHFLTIFGKAIVVLIGTLCSTSTSIHTINHHLLVQWYSHAQEEDNIREKAAQSGSWKDETRSQICQGARRSSCTRDAESRCSPSHYALRCRHATRLRISRKGGHGHYLCSRETSRGESVHL